MQDFFEIARTDFAAAFEGAWMFPVLLFSVLWILLKERDKLKKLLLCGVPALFLFLLPLSKLCLKFLYSCIAMVISIAHIS